MTPEPSARFPTPTTTSSAEGVVLADIVITHVLGEGRPGFAVRADNGANVYVSAGAVRTKHLQAGDVVSAVLVPNVNKPEQTPWFCRSVVRKVENPAEVQLQVSHESVVEVLRLGGGWTPEAVADEMFGEGAHENTSRLAGVQSALETAYAMSEGAVCKAVMFRRGAGIRVWFTMYPDEVELDEMED